MVRSRSTSIWGSLFAVLALLHYAYGFLVIDATVAGDGVFADRVFNIGKLSEKVLVILMAIGFQMTSACCFAASAIVGAIGNEGSPPEESIGSGESIG